MTPVKIALAALLLFVAAVPGSAQARTDLCPPGYKSQFNVNQPGCTFCFAPTDCDVQCLGSPTCFCEPGDTACCAANPCCDNCPGPKPLSCDTSSCQCEPGSCCSTVCPAPALAPASSTTGLALLVAALAALGAGAVRLAMRRG